MKELLFLVPVVGLAGLLFAIFLKSYVIKQDPGTDRMRDICRRDISSIYRHKPCCEI